MKASNSLIVLVTLCALGMAAKAQVFAYADCSLTGASGHPIDQHSASTGPITASCRAAGAGDVASDARASAGVLGAATSGVAYSWTDAQGHLQSASASGTTKAKFFERLTVTAPASLTGTLGHLDVPMLLSGSTAAVVSGGSAYQDARVSWSAAYESDRSNADGSMGSTIGYETVAGQRLSGASGSQVSWGQVHDLLDRRSSGPTMQGEGLPAVVTVPVYFYFNLPFWLTGSLQVKLALDSGSASFGDGASGAGDLLHTMRWGGVAGVFDATGAPVTQWALSSSSGIDFSRPILAVPEPSQLALLLAGMLTLAARRRRSRPDTPE